VPPYTEKQYQRKTDVNDRSSLQLC